MRSRVELQSTGSQEGFGGPHVALFLGALGIRGRERTLLAVAEALAARGAQVDLLTPGPTEELRNRVQPPVRLIDLNRWWMRLPWLGARNKRRIYLSPPALAAYLRRERPDVLLAASIPPNLAALMGHRLVGSSTRVILRQSNVLRIPSQSRYAGVRLRPRDRLIPWLYPTASAIIAVSHGVADNIAAFAGLSRERIHTIPNHNITTELYERAREPIDHPWFAPGAPPVILAVGRLVAKKDFPTLLRAFAQVRAVRETRLVILGEEGNQRPTLEALAAELGITEAVDLPGPTPNPFTYMARAAVFCLSSVFEGMPNVVVEALACGCPVVSTDCPSGPDEILEGGRYGRLVPMGDEQAMAEAILETLNHPPDRDRLRERGAQFSVERAVEQYLAVITTLARHP